MPQSPFAFAVSAVLAISAWAASPISFASTETRDTILEASVAPEAHEIAAPDWRGLRWDTWYFVGYQAVTVAVLHALPAERTNFDRSGASFSKWRDNVTNPVWDKDDHFVNYVLHPYWGAAYYIRARERGLDRWQSFGYSAFLSMVYELGAEALFEPVSYQDLIVTPVAGWLLGEYVFSPIREAIEAKPDPDAIDKAALILTDPMGALNGLTDRIFGVETQVSIAPLRPIASSGPSAAAWAVHGGSPGHYRPGPREVKWGVKLHVRW